MPRPTPAQTRTVAASPADAESSIRFSMLNVALLVAALAAITLGYVLLGGGDTVAAPLLLVLGYAILIPLGLIL
ncbi:MAG TPA: hypothetical protein VHG91_10710 [Longimicrobium sp.]|nr:hypothetical protein [Longimicrobium sp.]